MRAHLPVTDRPVLWTALLALAIAPGCGRTSGFLRDVNNINEHQFRMEIAAERYARSASGSASIGSLFCLVPLNNGAYRDAMATLHAQARLQKNEVLQNLREDHAFVFYALYCEDDLILSADVYEVVPALPPEPLRAYPDRGPILPPPAPASDPGQPGVFEPTDPYKPPANPYAPPPAGIVDAGARRSDPDVCERAHARLSTDLPPVFRAIYPNARFVDAPPRGAFVAACVEQVDDVQLCLQSTFLKAHVDPCRAAFRDLTPEQRTRLFGTFLREW